MDIGQRGCITSGNRLNFDGDTAAANVLDDYEEGVFTATCDNSVTLYSGNDSCQYVKVGSLVTVMGQIRVNSGNSNSLVSTIFHFLQ